MISHAQLSENCQRFANMVLTSTPEIHFYRASERPYGCFSNLWKCRQCLEPFVFEGRVFPTAEHAYQFGKPRDEKVRHWLMAAPSPSLLAMAAHGLYSWDIAPGWSKGRYDRMSRIVLAKFRWCAHARKILLGTGDAYIVECSMTDSAVNRRWGQVRGKGTNWLGKILMNTREILRKEASDAAT